MSTIHKLNQALQKQLDAMGKNSKKLFVVDVDKDQLWAKYLSSFPEGTNPMYKERTQHDCNLCRQFVKNIGAVVTINSDNTLSSVWDINFGDNEYQVVADQLSQYIKSLPIVSTWYPELPRVGVPLSRGADSEGVKQEWHHMSVEVPKVFQLTRGSTIGSVIGTDVTNKDVFTRSMNDFTLDSINVVLDLIHSNSIYRGAEFKQIVIAMKDCKQKFNKTKGVARTLFCWNKSIELGQAARFKNTVIGTLVYDLSTGVELDDAVRMYESKTAPQNYKRTTALITKGMIEKAQVKIRELGLEDSLPRRYAVEEDLTVNNVLFVDRSVRAKLAQSPLDELVPTESTKAPNLDKVQEITINKFIEDVLPNISGMELFVSNAHESNMVSLVAPVNDDSKGLFKWNNNFSWSYKGDVTDSIKERVKKAGGNVTGEVRASLSWSNYDDLDLHCKLPGNRQQVYYGNKYDSSTGCRLDVDENAGGGRTRTPVENIFWNRKRDMVKGEYTIVVHQFAKRENDNVGFTLQLDIEGAVTHYSYDKAVKDKQQIPVVTLNYDGKDVTVKEHHLPNSTLSKEVWGVNTEQFHKVKMMVLSPNHWDDQQVGNKHWFFVLDNCVNPESTRGFYNEFLPNELTEHRKVLEVLSSKMKAEYNERQLSGLGFSSTKPTSVLCKVSGSYNRVMKIIF